MRIALIVAMAQGGVIGRDNGLPWHLSEDLRHFKAMTLGKPVIMGRKTWDSIGRPLPGRTSIVISSNPSLVLPEGVLLVDSLDAALACGTAIAARDSVDECMVIGGATIYREALARASRIYLTEIELDTPGDAFFPPLDPAAWRELSCEHGTGAAAPHLAYRLRLLERAQVR
jgi:dihydrofolate reductase